MLPCESSRDFNVLPMYRSRGPGIQTIALRTHFAVLRLVWGMEVFFVGVFTKSPVDGFRFRAFRREASVPVPRAARAFFALSESNRAYTHEPNKGCVSG